MRLVVPRERAINEIRNYLIDTFQPRVEKFLFVLPSCH